MNTAVVAAWADEEPTELQTRAQTLFDEGRGLLRQARLDEACSKFGESYRLDAALGTLINLATCQELQGKLASAAATYAAVIKQAEASDDSARKDIAVARLERLRPKLSTLRIEVAEAMREQPFKLELDGTEIPKAELENPKPLDGGAHDITVLQPAHVTRREVLQLAPSGEHRVYTILPLEREPMVSSSAAAAVAPNRGTSSVAATPNAYAGPTPVSPLRVAGLVSFGVGASALAIGSYFGISAYSLYRQSKTAGCDSDNACGPGDGLALRDRAIRAGNIATWSYVAGGVFATAGVVLYVLGKPRPTTHGQVSLTFGPDLGLRLTRAF